MVLANIMLELMGDVLVAELQAAASSSAAHEKSLPADLFSDIQSGERLTTEWKRSWLLKDDIKAAMLAFANASGGRIFVGVDEKKNQDGQKEPEFVGATKSITACALVLRGWNQEFEPPLNGTLESYNHDGKRIDVIAVPAARVKPVGLKGVYRIRDTDGGHGMRPSELREAFLGLENHRAALLHELKHDLRELKKQEALINQEPVKVAEDCIHTHACVAVLVNGGLAAYFDFDKVREILYGLEAVKTAVERARFGTITQAPDWGVKRLRGTIPAVHQAIANYVTFLEEQT